MTVKTACRHSTTGEEAESVCQCVGGCLSVCAYPWFSFLRWSGLHTPPEISAQALHILCAWMISTKYLCVGDEGSLKGENTNLMPEILDWPPFEQNWWNWIIIPFWWMVECGNAVLLFEEFTHFFVTNSIGTFFCWLGVVFILFSNTLTWSRGCCRCFSVFCAPLPCSDLNKCSENFSLSSCREQWRMVWWILLPLRVNRASSVLLCCFW